MYFFICLKFPVYLTAALHYLSFLRQCNVKAVALDAYDNARFLCDQYYLTSPELDIEQLNCKLQENPDRQFIYSHHLLLLLLHVAQNPEAPVTIVYTPSHLYHILFELFKNAMRAVVELHGEGDSVPPIKITIVNAKEDLTIKVAVAQFL